MSPPIPAPRSQVGDTKKPIPTPRRVLAKDKNESPPKSSEENTNTFSRRVRSLSNASKQIAEDIGELMQDKKKAVIAGTRQSVRRITKRFNSFHQEAPTPEPENESDDFEMTFDLFNSISFQSPINSNPSIYNNVDEEDFGAPPPSHPPPPLPSDIIYDAPSTSGSTSNSDQSSNVFPQIYDSVFPVDHQLTRSESWKFYDSVNKNENVYNEVEAVSLPESSTVFSEGFDVNSNLSVDIRNSIYENHVISVPNEEVGAKCRESVILQFDPLKNNSTNNNNGTNEVLGNPTFSRMTSEDIRILEDFFQGDLYGNLNPIRTQEEYSTSNDSEIEEFISPPTPPVRFDSLPEDDQPPPPYHPKEKPRSQWFTGNEPIVQPQIEAKKSIGWFKQIKGALEKAPVVVRGVRNKDAIVQRPELELKNFVHKKGMLYKVQSGPVEDLFGEYSGRWCVLQHTNFICYADSSCESIKEHFPVDTILSIQILQDPKFKYKYDNEDLHCFELNTTGKSRGGHIYGARDSSERRVWMQSLAESLTKKFSAKITTDYIRMGWAYLREGVGGKWLGAWIMISQRTLFYILDNETTKSMDLRKARCIILQPYREHENNPRTNDKGPNIVVDSPNITLYLRMWTSRETKVWCHIIKLGAYNNGAYLDQQQLTKNDIPVLVEKCINFIYTHGSMTEGIYRRSGSNTSVSEILTKFRKDAWAVQLTRDNYTEHDVATALKRFIRDLPEPILSSNQHQYLNQVSLINNREEKIRMYKASLEQLPPTSYKTFKKLLGHLHFISTQHTKNLMNVDNLAAVWSPSLMHQEPKELKVDTESARKHLQNTVVVRQLIDMFKDIFPEDPQEIEKEKLMLQVLKKHSQSPQNVSNTNKNAGDFRVWVYLHSKEGQAINISIGPNKTAYEVCVELSSKIDIPVHELILEETVLNDHLQRPIHFSEKVLDIILRWSYWDEPDRKDNSLIVVPITKYADFILDRLVPVSGELRFSDSRSKNFKTLMFEFSQAKLNCFKDKTCEDKLFTYKIEDILYYLGNEPKKNPHSKWTMTFIEVKGYPKRSKNMPYFGNIIVWNDPQSRAEWVGCMIKSRHRESILQPAMHIDLMER